MITTADNQPAGIGAGHTGQDRDPALVYVSTDILEASAGYFHDRYQRHGFAIQWEAVNALHGVALELNHRRDALARQYRQEA